MHRFLASLAFLTACSSNTIITVNPTADSGTPQDDGSVDPGDGSPAMDGQTVDQSMTWNDGKKLTSPVVIPVGVTVTIAPGATITCSGAVSITVLGTLTGSSAQASHAKLTGASWLGIIANGKGQVLLDGVDLVGAAVGIDDSSSVAAQYDNGTISFGGHPFLVKAAATLSSAHTTIVTPSNDTQVEGAFTGSYLDYDANGGYAVYADDPAANVFIEDSKFHGANAGDPDLLNAYGASKFHVAYTDITGAHCGFHFAGVATLEVDHVTVHGVTNGADLWGSGTTGTRTIMSSNFENLSVGFDEHGKNGAIGVTNCYESVSNNLATSTAVTITSPASMPIPNAGPR